MEISQRLKAICISNGHAVDSISIGQNGDKATWRVQPPSLQAACQPFIDVFDPNDPVAETADLDAQVKRALDTERLYSAIVWTIIDTYSPPATAAKYNAGRTKIIASFKAQPWKP